MQLVVENDHKTQKMKEPRDVAYLLQGFLSKCSLLYFNSMLTSLTKVKVPSELLLQISTKVRKHPTLHASQALKKAPKYFDCKV